MRHGQSFIIILFCLFVFIKGAKAQDREIDSLKQALTKMPADSNKVKTLRLLFIAVIDKQSADKGIPVAKEQLALAIKINDVKGIASAYKLLNVGYQTIGDLETAIDYSLKSLKIYEQLNDQPGIGSSYSNIGVIYRDENKLDEALSYFKKSLEIYSRFKNKQENIWRAYINIGMTYERLGNDSLALINYQLSLTSAQIITAHQQIFVSTSLYHIANIYFNRKQPVLSNKYLSEAVKYLDGGQQAYPAAEIYILLSKTYVQENRLNEALAAAKTGLAIVQKENYKTQLAENYLQLARVYAAMKQYNEAYQYQSRYVGAKDSLVNDVTAQKIAKLQYDYELQKKESVNRELLKDKKLKVAEISLQKTIIQRQYAVGAFIGIGLLSFILMSVFYYRNLQVKKRDNNLLQAQQQEIIARNHEIIAQNEEITSQKESLAQINQTKNKLFSIISHDLRSPVLTLQDALTLVNNQLLTREEFDELSEELLKNVASTSAMLDNVLYWAKSQMEASASINKHLILN